MSKVESDTDDEFVCDVCGRAFETAAEREAHLRSEGLVD